jgi:hypothetical protein
MTTGLGLVLMGLVLLVFVALFVHMMRGRGRLPARVRQLAPASATALQSYRRKVANERAAFGPYVALVASAYLWALGGGGLLMLDGLALMHAGNLLSPWTPRATRWP